MRYERLRDGRKDGPCRGRFELDRPGRTRCTHGPDRAPPNTADVRERRSHPMRLPVRQEVRAQGLVPDVAAACLDGTSGPRVQVAYAHALDVPNRLPTLLGNIRAWAAEADAVVNASAAETGGARQVRFVTDPACAISVLDIPLTAIGDDTFSGTVTDLENLGYTRPDRKYLVFVDANLYCGIGEIYHDDSAGPSNLNNANGAIPGMIARVDNGCWEVAGQSVAAHELLHNLGAVQASAPHATALNHCVDDSDRMCYPDDDGVTMQQVCPSSHENRLDCGHDDYFSTNPTPCGYLSTHWNTANSAFLSGSSTASTVTGCYAPLTPARILDTRNRTGGVTGPIAPGRSFDLKVTGVGGVPATGAGAVVINITATQPTSGGWLTVYPTGTTAPVAASMAWTAAGQTVSNLVVAKVGNGGKITLLNAAGSVQLIAEVSGWYSDGTGTQPNGGLYRPLAPARLLDTRDGTGGVTGPIGPGQSFNLKVTGAGGVPASGVSAVVLNITATQPTSGGWLTVYPTGATAPLAASMTWGPNQTVSNLVVAKVGSGGKVTLLNAPGSVQLIAEVFGWYADGTATQPMGGLYRPLSPARVLDTRNGTGGVTGPIAPGQSFNLQVTGMGGAPATGVGAVVLNVTATQPTTGGWLTVYPTGDSAPRAASITWGPNQTASNLVVAKLGSGGRLTLLNAPGSVQLIAEVFGWYTA